MKFAYIAILFFQSTFLAALPLKNEVQYEVKVHPGTELLHIVNYLAGVNQPLVKKSSYLDDVDEWFGEYINHPAVKHAKELPYNDFADLGWCFEGKDMNLSIPDRYGYFGHLISTGYLEKYLKLSQQFAQDTRFWDFYQEQESNFRNWENEFTAALERDLPLQALDDFFKVPFDKVIYFSISPMGTSLKANLFLDEINPKFINYAPVIIPYDRNFVAQESTEPNFEYHHLALTNSVWHEVSHLYWEEINGGFREEIGRLTYSDDYTSNFNTFDDRELNTYFFVHELVADGVAIFLKKEFIDEDLAEEHLLINESVGGMLFRDFVQLVESQYYYNREEKNFRKFIPQFIEMIENKNP
ncbi:DUF4932 domain-containing protein [Anditalea andensis]|uniref:DUF4932 domain-containing protein n=1 Tax=Anditalea andensis TaxID=1048983 RepID=A0A074L5W6_9BACT|nr:DUF4932 domain-containing protein [Anditalea andensis]KEO75218.1 hypothetical protein EL17_06035 [Anditalea andensis]